MTSLARLSLAVLLFLFAFTAGAALAEPAPADGVPAPPPEPHAGIVVAAGPSGFGFSSIDGRDSLFVHWLVQTDELDLVGPLPPGTTARNSFLVGFAGLQLDATLRGVFHSSFLVDFSQGRLTLLDAFVEARIDPRLIVRVGKFPTPISEERLAPKIMLPWISTSPASFLLPVRETGLQLYGELFAGVVQYNASLVNGSYAGSITEADVDSAKDGMGRLMIHPFKLSAWSGLRKLGVGVGGSYGDRKGTLTSPETAVLRSYGNAVFFSYRSDGTAAGTTLADGAVARVVPHAIWSWGPVAAFADYVHEVDHFGGTAVLSDAYSASATIALTGEDAEPFARINVRRPIDVQNGRFGGVQMILGAGSVRVGDSAFPTLANPLTAMQRATVLGAGVNWYPFNGVGLLVDLSRTTYAAFANGPARPAENAIYCRLEMRL